MESRLNTTTMYQRKTNVVFRHIGEEGLAIIAESGDIIGLNETGGFLLEKLTSPQSKNSLAALLISEFSVENCQQDVQLFIDSMVESNLIEIIHPS